MPADIRSFFGGGGGAPKASQGSQKKDEVSNFYSTLYPTDSGFQVSGEGIGV